MKKTFLVKRNALLTSRNVSWGVCAFAVSLVVLLIRFAAPNLFWQVLAPAFRASDAFTTESHAFLNNFSNAASLAERNEKLTSENFALASDNRALLQKVANLSSLSGSSVTKNDTGISAGVVARPPESPYDTLLLAAGERNGVLAGMEAFGNGGVPIGIVSSVWSDFSRITLFSSAGSVTSGWVGYANVPITITGAGAGAMNASASRSAGVVVGDVVFVPGPGMLPIGSIVRIDSDPLSPGVTLRIRPAVNPFSIAWVELRSTGVVAMMFATSTTP